MTPKLKLFFDECVSSPRLARELTEFYRDAEGNSSVEIVLLQQKFKSGESDENWLKKLKDEGDWIVITKDKGHSTGPKLPVICPALGITHVVMSKGIDHAGFEAQKQAYADVWPFLRLAVGLPRGTRIQLRYTNTEPKKRNYALEKSMGRK